MNLPGLGFVLLFFILMIVFSIINRRRGRSLRDIPAFYRLGGAIELSVEDGTRVHVSIGRNSIIGPRSASALVGLSMLGKITRTAADGDHPPVASAGDATLVLLAQDTLRGTYQSMGMLDNYDHSLGRATGLTPYSYAAGTIPVVLDEDVSANVLAGSFGDEIALTTITAERKDSFTLAGSDSLTGQAVLYATADEPLIGEELYAGGAYLDVGSLHVASLHAQDLIRYLLILVIIGATLANVAGIF